MNESDHPEPHSAAAHSSTGGGGTMSDRAAPIVDNPGRPPMPGDRQTVMEALGSVDGQDDQAEGNVMTPTPTNPSLPAMDSLSADPTSHGRLQPRDQSTDGTGTVPDTPRPAQTGGGIDGYVRLVVAYTAPGGTTPAEGDGAKAGDAAGLSVKSARVVRSGLAKPELPGAWHYQALVDDRRVGFGTLPDLLEVRGIAPPDDPDAGHSFALLDHASFVVRIPTHEVTLTELERLTVELTEGEPHTDTSVPEMTIQEQAAAADRPIPTTIAVLEGIDLSSLDRSDIADLQEHLR